MNWTWRSLPMTLLFWSVLSNSLSAQITPAPNSTGTTVTPNGQQLDIGGGALSGNGRNLFHIFRDFNVGNGQTANFLSNPQIRNILAGVNGGNASYINGLIQITGGNSNLYLLNPAGIVFGANARLNVPAAFHASTAQRVHFEGGVFDVNGYNTYSQLNSNPTGFEFLNRGILINEGQLGVNPGQTLSLMAHQVINTGTLSAPAGTINILAVPETGMVRVSQDGMLLSLEIPQERLPIDGTIAAVDLPSLLTGNGIQTVNSVIQNADGTISLIHDPTKIPLGTNTAVIGGSLSVANPTGSGGQMTITGHNTALINANLNASGQQGGGTILLGGDYLGGTTGTNRLHSSFNAQNLFINSGSLIAADALSQGNGGTVIAWADNATQFYGKITARGGQLQGDGGFVETSGRNILNAFGQVDASANNGRSGTWLLDPIDVEITNSGPEQNFSESGGIFSPTGSPSSILNTTIETALGSNTNVIITTSGSGGDLGNITVLAPINKSSTNDASLTLRADGNIFIFANITTNLDSKLDIILQSGANGGSGAINITGAELFSNGGDIILGGGTNPLNTPATSPSGSGIRIDNSTLNAGGGNISIRGLSINNGPGVFIGNSSNIQTLGSGSITINGTGGANIYGILLEGIFVSDASITAQAGSITLTGIGGTGGEAGSSIGINLRDTEIRTTTGAITLTGTGGTGAFFNDGILGNSTSITSQSGNITLRGTSSSDVGIKLIGADDGEYNAEVRTGGNGNILLEGRGGAGADGIELDLTDDLLTLEVSNGTLTLASSSDILIFDNSLEPNGAIFNSTGAGRLVFQTVNPNTPIGVGDGANGSLLIDQFILDRISGGFSLVTIGNPNGTGLIDVRPFSLNYNLALQTPSTGSAGIQFNGAGTTNLNGRSLTLNSGGGVTQGSHAIAAGTLQLLGRGNVNLSNGGNQFQALSGNVVGRVSLSNQGALNITSFNNGVNGLTTGINTNGNPLIFNLANGSLTQNAPIQAGSLGLTLQNGSAILTNPNNQVGTLAAQLNNASDLQFINNGSLTVGSVNPTGITGRNIFLQTLTGNIVLNAPISAFGTGNAIVLVAGNNFINNFGPTVFTNPNGRWLVYSTDPNLDVRGGLTGSEQFNTTYPGAALFSGSGFLYRVAAPLPPAPPPDPPAPPPEPPAPPPSPQIEEDLGRILFGEEVQETELPENTAQVVYFPGVEIIRQQIGNAFDQGDYGSAIKLLEQLYSFEFSDYFGEFFATPGQEGLQNLDIGQIQALLARMAEETGQKPALTYVFWRPGQLDIFIVTPTGEPIYQPVRVSQEELQRVIAAFNREVRDPTKTNTQSYLPFAQQLYQWILGNVDAELQARGITTLVFAMDQGLRGLPIAALHSGSNLLSAPAADVPMGRNGQFLVERYNLGLVPSINLVDTRYQPLQNARVLAMGASEFQNHSPLPAVPIELETITQLVGQGSEFLNEQFTIQNLETQRRRTQYPILHLATHGEFNPGKPQNSYIQFWDSQLSMAQLRQLRLFRPPTELMTLSACRTAVGSPQAELGFAGLALQAGVKTSVASLWYVSDEGTLALMTEFYQQLGTAPIKAEALRQAQLALLKGNVMIEDNALRSSGVRGGFAIPLPEGVALNGTRQLSHPYFWAPFTAIGSPW